MQIRTSSDWRDALPFDTPVRADEAMPGEPARCAACPVDEPARDRADLWAVKLRHPNNPAGFVRLYCGIHRPLPRRMTPEPEGRARRQRSAAPRKPAAPSIPERPAVLCPDCFIEVPPSGLCGMCGQQVG
ncbi:glucose-6-phosphate dehydrogenase [Microbacterium invictum]|uniref:Glucose-6-phosphate dehydrogenase n=1 Tax=Microbacterium invictum TaxID=515415 RepID=A0AA40SL85_9MICO|nr:glucose-6-phosphate dehydrogenase [Microbacterium invictum]MBB4138283.1 hypothetical protein [Microbacterium invictum]